MDRGREASASKISWTPHRQRSEGRRARVMHGFMDVGCWMADGGCEMFLPFTSAIHHPPSNIPLDLIFEDKRKGPKETPLESAPLPFLQSNLLANLQVLHEDFLQLAGEPAVVNADIAFF